ncbi:MAG: hypothetical protein M1840_002182 [Geoglossum simile]|nr:MAG: hypothetical protein M1840_002182 [Geoglossum simile]
MASWIPPTGLPDFIIAPIREAIEKMPPHHLLPPQAGEVLDPDQAYERLQDYAFSQGFCIVISSRDKANTNIRYTCIHHGHTTRNWRKLDEHKTEESNRQKEYTNIRARGCPWQVYISYKGITRGADQKAWFLGITNGSHAGTHDMVPNPLAYSLHAKRQPQYAAAIQQAITLRAAQISYSQASRIMAVQDLKLDRNAFYNTQRSSNKQQDGPELLPLLDFLNEKRYHIRSRYCYEMDSAIAEPISRQLEQLFFMSDSQIQWTQLPLTILTSISNTGDSFPMPFCFLPSESKVCFDFIFESLKELVWEEYPPPVVIVRDQAKGLSSSLPYSMPGSIGQFCEWHAFENIKKHIMDHEYAKEKINTTKPLIWNYLQANTSSTLTAARTKLFKALKSPEVRYIKNN